MICCCFQLCNIQHDCRSRGRAPAWCSPTINHWSNPKDVLSLLMYKDRPIHWSPEKHWTKFHGLCYAFWNTTCCPTKHELFKALMLPSRISIERKYTKESNWSNKNFLKQVKQLMSKGFFSGFLKADDVTIRSKILRNWQVLQCINMKRETNIKERPWQSTECLSGAIT